MSKRRPWRSGVAVCVVFATGLSLLLLGGRAGRWHQVANLPARLVTGWLEPQGGANASLRGRERRAVRELAGQLDARIVWSSNRSGNHELYVLDLSDQSFRQLTDNPHVDFASRFSPAGDWIVFARSQRRWVSFRDTDSWDLYLVRADGSDERLLVRGGYHPTWGSDGSSVIFQRGTQVIEIDLEGGNERVLLEPGVVLEGKEWGDPALHPAGNLLALAVKQLGAVVMAPGAADFASVTEGQACQTTWVPGTEELLWVEPHGNGGTRIMRGAANGTAAEVLMDLPGERSHEYFPGLSDDGAWLVWGAAAKGHEHDRADYDIYLWRVGEPWESAVRLTHYGGNDQWPDLHLAASGADGDRPR